MKDVANYSTLHQNEVSSSHDCNSTLTDKIINSRTTPREQPPGVTSHGNLWRVLSQKPSWTHILRRKQLGPLDCVWGGFCYGIGRRAHKNKSRNGMFLLHTKDVRTQALEQWKNCGIKNVPEELLPECGGGWGSCPPLLTSCRPPSALLLQPPMPPLRRQACQTPADRPATDVVQQRARQTISSIAFRITTQTLSVPPSYGTEPLRPPHPRHPHHTFTLSRPCIRSAG